MPSQRVAFGIGHRITIEADPMDWLATPKNYLGTWLFRNRALRQLPALLHQRFPQGTRILALGCSSGEGNVMTPALWIDQHMPSPGPRADQYPIEGVDRDVWSIDVAQLHLLGSRDLVDMGNEMGKEAFDATLISRSDQRQWLSVILASLHDAVQERLTHQFQPTAVPIASADSLAQAFDMDGRVRLYQLQPRITRRLHYQVGNALALCQDHEALQRGMAWLLQTTFYTQPADMQLAFALAMSQNLTPGTLVVSSRLDERSFAAADLWAAAGFERLSPEQTGGVDSAIYVRPDHPRPDAAAVGRFMHTIQGVHRSYRWAHRIEQWVPAPIRGFCGGAAQTVKGWWQALMPGRQSHQKGMNEE
ncbi:MAG: hypothetical protein R2857_15695 [Vampirovibrionales bacterium]